MSRSSLQQAIEVAFAVWVEIDIDAKRRLVACDRRDLDAKGKGGFQRVDDMQVVGKALREVLEGMG